MLDPAYKTVIEHNLLTNLENMTNYMLQQKNFLETRKYSPKVRTDLTITTFDKDSEMQEKMNELKNKFAK